MTQPLFRLADDARYEVSPTALELTDDPSEVATVRSAVESYSWDRNYIDLDVHVSGADRNFRAFGCNPLFILLCRPNKYGPMVENIAAMTAHRGRRSLTFIPLYENTGYADIERDPKPVNSSVILDEMRGNSQLVIMATGESKYARHWFRDHMCDQLKIRLMTHYTTHAVGLTKKHGMPMSMLQVDYRTSLYQVNLNRSEN